MCVLEECECECECDCAAFLQLHLTHLIHSHPHSHSHTQENHVSPIPRFTWLQFSGQVRPGTRRRRRRRSNDRLTKRACLWLFTMVSQFPVYGNLACWRPHLVCSWLPQCTFSTRQSTRRYCSCLLSLLCSVVFGNPGLGLV